MKNNSATLILLVLISFEIVAEVTWADISQEYFRTLIEPVTVQGSAFSPPEIEKLVSEALSMIPPSLLQRLSLPEPSTGFILAEKDSLSLILSDKSGEGFARVKGFMLKSSLNFRGIKLAIILAQEVSITTDGEYTEINDILLNPEAYELKLVRVIGVANQLPVIYDPDDHSNTVRPILIGCLSEEPLKSQLFEMKSVIRNAKNIIKAPFEMFSQLSMECLPYIGYNKYGFLLRNAKDTIINGIVILPGSSILSLLSKISPLADIFIMGKPFIYLIKEEFPKGDPATVTSIKENPELFLGKLVELTVNAIGGRISVQETLKEVEGEQVPVDILLQGFVSWDGDLIPTRKNIILLLGASNHHQDTVYLRINGSFKVLGEVVPAFQIDESLSDKVIIEIYHIQKLDNINLQEMADITLDMLLHKLGEANFVLTNFVEKVPPHAIPIEVPEIVVNSVHPILVRRPEDLPREISISRRVKIFIKTIEAGEQISIHLRNSSITNVEFTLDKSWSELEILIMKLSSLPPTILPLDFPAYEFYQVEVNAPNEIVTDVSIEFWVKKVWINRNSGSYQEVRLLRWSGCEWEVLPTIILGENATHVRYMSRFPSFSFFAIVLMKVGEAPNVINTTISVTYDGKPLSGFSEYLIVQVMDETGNLIEVVEVEISL